MKQRVREMEMEAEKLREMQAQVEKEMNESGAGQDGGGPIEEDKEAVDGRSVYVGNVSFKPNQTSGFVRHGLDLKSQKKPDWAFMGFFFFFLGGDAFGF